MNLLSTVGFDRYLSLRPDVQRELASGPESLRAAHFPARVVRQERDLYRVVTAQGERQAHLAGKLRLTLHERADVPVPGDYVLVSGGATGRLTINARLPRTTHLERAAPGSARAQTIAANLDAVCLVSGLDLELNPRRIERYLSAIAAGGARPVLALNKADLWRDRPDELAARVAAIEAVAAGAEVHVVSVIDGAGLEDLRAALVGPELTVALVGSSGVGKSSLTNAFLGFEQQDTGGVREHDSHGRHTTTRRDVFLLEGGGVLIDTPGMRELGLWDASGGVEAAFPELAAFSGECRYKNCQHLNEPECAVLAALERGEIEGERFEGYHKLSREAKRRERKAKKVDREAAKRRNRRKRERPRTPRRDTLAEW